MGHRQVSFRTAVIEAADLVGADCATDNPEYLRGVCELMARCFPVKDVDTHDRAEYFHYLVTQLAED